MFQAKKTKDHEADCELLLETAREFCKGEDDLIALLANLSALIMAYVADLNWAGFYLEKGNGLVLGPFQGKPACTRIARGKGVCGKAAAEAKPVIVADVHLFPGHIACDSASASELAVPFFRDGGVFGVIDLDSPSPGRFTETESACIEKIAGYLTDFLDGQP